MRKEYNVLYGQNIFDVVLSTTKDFNSIYQLIKDNEIDGINEDLDASPNLVIAYETPDTLPADFSISTIEIPSTMVELKAIERQSLFDMALMTYGTLDLIYKLIKDNGVSNISSRIDQQIFTFDSTLIVDNFVYLKNINNNIKYGTNIASFVSGGLQTDDGIQIQTDDGIDIIVD